MSLQMKLQTGQKARLVPARLLLCRYGVFRVCRLRVRMKPSYVPTATHFQHISMARV